MDPRLRGGDTDKDQRLMADIMLRVRFVHGLRMLMSPAMLKGFALAASLVVTLVLVSIKHCLENLSHLKAASYLPYMASSYLHTSFVVQAAVVLGLAAAAWVARDILSTSWSTFRLSRLSYKAM